MQNIINTIAYLDGSLRDIYIHHVTLDDWNRLLKLLKKSYHLESDEKIIPETIQEIISIQQDRGFLLRVYIGKNITANCHFYVSESEPSPIEFDLDPRELHSTYGIQRLLEFISKLGKELDKEVILSEENSEENVLLTYSPSKNKFSYKSSSR